MLQVIKWVFRVLFTLVIILIVAALVLPKVIDPNHYKDQISTLIKQQTGRDVTFDGELSVSIFPWLGFQTQKLELAQPSEIGGNMVSVDAAQLRLKVLPLLSKKIEIDTVVLDSPSLRIVTLKNGVDSFAGLTEHRQEAEQSDTDSNTAAPIALVIQGLALSNGTLIWDDRQTGSRYDVTDVNFVSGNLIGGQFAPLQVSGNVIDASQSEVLNVNLSAQLQLDTQSLSANAQEIQLSLQQPSQSVEMAIAELSFDQNSSIVVQEISALFDSIHLNGQSATLYSPQISLDVNTQKLTVASTTLTLANMVSHLNDVEISQLLATPIVSGKLNVPTFDAQSMVKKLSSHYQPTKDDALKNVSLTADFVARIDESNSRFSVNNLVANIDQSTLKGRASLLNPDNPSYDFLMNLDSINMDDYLPVDDETESQNQPASGAAALAVPMAMFKDVFANGRFTADSLISGGLELKDIDVNVASTPSKVTITPRAQLYDGQLGGVIEFTDKGNQQALRVRNEIDLVNLNKILTAAEVTDQLTGIGSLVFDIVVTEKDGVQSNEGMLKLFAKNGALKGVNFKGLLDTAYANYQSFRGQQVSADKQDNSEGVMQANDETRFAELLGTFNVKNFNITNNDFSLKAPLFRVGGRGDINLASQTLDYAVNISIVNSTNGQGGEALEKLKGVTLPIRFTGDLTSPKYSIDTKTLFNNLVKREIDEKKGDYLERKFGIEDGAALSTKDSLKQVLLNKLLKKDKPDNPSESPQQNQELKQTPSPSEQGTSQYNNEQTQSSKDNRSEKDKLKDQITETLLNSIFD